MNESGVYLIRNNLNNKLYIGSATGSMKRRWGQHISELRRGVHSNRHLQAAWNKYGEEAFTFEVIICCAPELCVEYEQMALEHFDVCNETVGYNICRIAGNTKGLKFTPESIAKLSESAKAAHARQDVKEKRAKIMNDPEYKIRHAESMKKVMDTPEYKEKMSHSVTEALSDPAVRQKISEGVRRALANPETREKLRKASTGRKHTTAAKAKISAALSAPEMKKRISNKLKGKKKSPATIEKMKKPKSAETRLKMKDGAKKGWLTRKANLAKAKNQENLPQEPSQ
jgi:group I intron endonuclease